jgi:hypothetical protein
MMQATVHLINAQAGYPMAAGGTKVRCDWANQLVPGLDNVVGNVMGVALTVGQLLLLAAVALLMLLFATKHGSLLIKIIVGVIAFGLLLNSGWLPVSSPCS